MSFYVASAGDLRQSRFVSSFNEHNGHQFQIDNLTWLETQCIMQAGRCETTPAEMPILDVKFWKQTSRQSP